MSWSPDPAFDDLIAVGYSNGKVDLLRLQATKSARNASLTSGPVVTLPVRNTRSCNALAFCSADPNYLAVGLDKVRGDASLVIWDIVTASASLSIKSPTQLTFNVPPSAGPPRPMPQIPRGETAARTDPRVLQQLAPAEVVFLDAKIESELQELDDESAAELLESIGQHERGLDALARAGFHTLRLQTYLTAGPKEARAWVIRQGDTAPKAAGVIHTDFEKGFIRAEIYSLEDLEQFHTEKDIRAHGKLRVEGKDYEMRDGDICHFLVNK